MTQQPFPPQQPEQPSGLPSREQRQMALGTAVAREVGRGGRVEAQTDFSATIVRGQRPNHILHLILTLVTCSAWGLVWLLIAIFSGEKRTVLNVDQWGNVSVQR